MEPLSIAASALTVLGAVEAAFQSIKAYRDAPSQLEALGNEIVDITAVVTEAGRVITESQNSVHSRADKTLHLTSALTNIRDKARELEVLFRSCVVINSLPSAGHKTSRIKWLKARGKVQSLRNELSNGRLNLLVALANFSASSSLRIELSVQDIFMVANETKEHQQRLEDRLSVERDRDRFAQTQLSEKVLAQVEKLQLHRHSVAHQQTYVQGEPELRDSTPMNTWASEQVQSIVQARKFPAVAIPSPLRSDSLSHISDDWSGMGIRANLGNIPDCSRSCKCSCHLRRRLQTPRLLEGLLGTLFLGYSGSPILSQNCDQSSCRGGKCSSASFTYQFPRWFVQSRMIELQAKITAMYGPELLLRFNRVVDGKALVFHYASTGNVEKMKQLFEQGRASPSDVRIDSGWTPLHYAIQNNQVGICKLLLQAGSDPHMETEAPLTPAYYAAGVILGGTGFDISAIDGLRELFHDPAFLEYARFSDLHKVVLQLQGGSVHEELQRSIANLDATDVFGRTPLSWAVQRGEVETVRLLLEYGADPNNQTNTNGTILHYSAQASTPECLLLLIQNGARITQNARGYTALHYACSFHDDLTYVKPLLDHGAGLDTRTYVGKTALSFAIIHNHIKTAAFLIERGASLDVLDNEGQSPLYLSIIFRRFEAMKLLLRFGATHRPLSESGDTLLHAVATFPDVRIIEHLLDCDLSDEDVDARNRDHLTPRELLQMHNSDPEIALAFHKLLTKVSNKWKPNVARVSEVLDDSDSDSSGEIFEDVAEQ